jgi:murein DD-endopeptidase MepM/ murein hydrolase activator NlpD
MRRWSCALAFAGAIVFVLDVSWGDVSLSSAVLTAPATGVAVLPEEPFLSPLGKRDAEVVSGFGKRDVVVQVRPPAAGHGQAAAAVGGTLQPKVEVHEGVDYAVPLGAEIRAVKSGKVLFAGFSKMYVSRNDKTDQHRLVIVRHADGQSSRYVHLEKLRVRPGQEVKAGQVLGVAAASDECAVPVLHFEIRTAQGKAIDPETVITEGKTP